LEIGIAELSGAQKCSEQEKSKNGIAHRGGEGVVSEDKSKDTLWLALVRPPVSGILLYPATRFQPNATAFRVFKLFSNSKECDFEVYDKHLFSRFVVRLRRFLYFFFAIAVAP
jgi:hypothetical protein